MALREFDDADGARWWVWDTVPGTAKGLADDFRAGWLTFDSGAERRRLAPIPDGWAELAPERLRLLLGLAYPARPRAAAATPTDGDARRYPRSARGR